MANFAATTSDGPDHVRVALAGDCDLAVRDQLSEALLAAVHRCDTVVVDLAAVEFLDSSGLHGLVAAHRAAAERGGRLYVENPTGTVAAVLDLTGVAALLSRNGLRPEVAGPGIGGPDVAGLGVGGRGVLGPGGSRPDSGRDSSGPDELGGENQ
jgi:anti-anti-sigma factor